MRRALLVAAIALPLNALAAQSAGKGQNIEVNNYSTATGLSYINKAQCEGQDTLHLQWNINPTTVVTTVGPNQNHQIIASNTAPDSTGYCPANDETKSIFSAQVTSPTATALIQDGTASGTTAATNAHVTCGPAGESQIVYICVHWVEGDNKLGVASGKFKIQVAAPGAPSLDSVDSGDGQLIANYTAPSGGADHYKACAMTPGTMNVVSCSSTTTGLSATIDGLTNNVAYDVYVYAYSEGGNEGPAGGPKPGTPLPSAGFWETYKERGGVEQGGCGTGGAGVPALLGAIAFLALRRRVR